MDREDKLKKLIVQFEEQDNTLDLQIKLTEANDTIRKLHGQIGNLEVQNADYSQIVQELSDKLNSTKKNTEQYSNLKIPKTKNYSIFPSTELDGLIINYMHIQLTAMLFHYAFLI